MAHDSKQLFGSRASRRSFLQGLGAAAVGLTFADGRSSGAFAAEEAKLNFYNWDTYIGETTLDEFKKASGVDVNMSLFATNDELFAKLRAGNPGYDVIVPGSEFVERMIKADLLMGQVSEGRLNQLMALLGQARERNLPELDPILDDIELRVGAGDGAHQTRPTP